jgi:hypothetical protein
VGVAPAIRAILFANLIRSSVHVLQPIGVSDRTASAL